MISDPVLTAAKNKLDAAPPLVQSLINLGGVECTWLMDLVQEFATLEVEIGRLRGSRLRSYAMTHRNCHGPGAA